MPKQDPATAAELRELADRVRSATNELSAVGGELRRLGRSAPSAERWGLAEIAEAGGVSPQAAHKWTQAPDFPEPDERFKMGAVWIAADVRRWAKRKGKTIS